MRALFFLGLSVGVLAPGGARGEDIFLRGDANADGLRTLSDSAYATRYLLLGGPAPSCMDALDVDDDGNLTIGDPITVLNYLFAGMPPPPEPTEVPGPDPTADGLSCQAGVIREPSYDGGQRIAVACVRGAPGEVVQVPILLTNTAVAEGFQLTFRYDEATLLEGDAEFAPRDDGDSFDFRIARDIAPGVLRVGILADFGMRGVPAIPIRPGADQALVTLSFRIEEGAAAGVHPLAVVRDAISSEISEGGLSVVPLLVDGSIAVSSGDLSAPRDAACARVEGGVAISWTNGAAYDEVRILRDGDPIAAISGDSTGYTDAEADSAQHAYLVYGVKGGAVTRAAACAAPGPLFPEPAVPGPRDLSCETRLPEIEVDLSWTNPVAYDAVRIYRNGVVRAELAGDATSWTDAIGEQGALTYAVAGVLAGEESGRASCRAGIWNDPPEELHCELLEGGRAARLAWTNPHAYEEIRILRDGDEVAVLPGDATSFEDPGPLAEGRREYTVAGSRAALEPASASCTVEVIEERFGAPFLRGDGNTDGVVTVADACFLLMFLFAGGQRPDCLDAGDTDDQGILTIGDPIRILNHLFAGGPPWEEPSAVPGIDPTPDPMSCVAGRTRSAVRDPSQRIALSVEAAEPGGDASIGLMITNTAPVDGLQLAFAYDPDALALGRRMAFPGDEPPDFANLWEIAAGRARVGIVFDFGLTGEMHRLAPGAERLVAAIPVEVAAGAPRDLYPLAFLRGGREGELSEDGISVIPTLEDGAVVVAAAGVEPPRDLACAEEGGDAVLSWTNGEAYDRIIVLRNARRIAELAGDATGLRDPDPGPAASIYWVHGVRGGDPSAPVRCTVGEGVIPAPVDLACALDPAAWDVTLDWANPVAYDAIEVLRNGALLAELPGDAAGYTDLDIPPASYAYTVVGVIDGIRSEAATCRVGQDVLPPFALSCEILADCDVTLAWQNGDDYDAVVIRRDGETVAELAGGAASYHDTSCVPVGESSYEVMGVRGGYASRAATCRVRNEGPVDPVDDLACAASEAEVRLTWTNRDLYEEIVIARDGIDIAAIPGDREEYVGDPVAETTTFAVRGRIGDLDGPARTCTIYAGILLVAGDVDLQGPGDRQASVIELTAGVETQGLSLGLTHDPEVVTAVDITWEGTALEAIRGGAGPDFFRWDAYDLPETGVTLGIVFAFMGGEVLEGAADPRAVARIIYEPAPGALDGATCALAFSDALGDPPVTTVVVSGGTSLRPLQRGGTATVHLDAPLFKRGDCNDDGVVDIGDPIAILNYLFDGGPAPGCLDWADANDDGRVDIADPVYLAMYSMGDGKSPKSPHENCGLDPTPDALPPCGVASSSCQ